MIYLDTSVLVAMHTNEASTATVLAWYGQLGTEPICSATWCVTEFASALSFKQRIGQATARQAKQAWKQFASQCAGDLRLLQVDAEAFRQAAILALDPDHGLRAGDALHLAVASQMRIQGLLTLDALMRTNAIRLGFQIVALSTG
jgi:predicted nucleic acid-binding protein